MVDANLLVTYEPTHSEKAKEEVESVLQKAGAKAKFLESRIAGVFQLSVNNPKAIVKKLIALCKSDIDKFKLTNHYVPIDKWTESNIKAMQKVTEEMGKQIDKKEKWKMNLNKRKFEGDYRELIVKLTDPIDKPNVDLSNPDKIVQVEIVGDKAGIALLKKDELLEVSKLK